MIDGQRYTQATIAYVPIAAAFGVLCEGSFCGPGKCVFVEEAQLLTYSVFQRQGRCRAYSCGLLTRACHEE